MDGNINGHQDTKQVDSVWGVRRLLLDNTFSEHYSVFVWFVQYFPSCWIARISILKTITPSAMSLVLGMQLY